jgi:hypothetical protein
MTRDELRYAVWLDPDPAEAVVYQTVKDSLRERFGGPEFPLHLTLTSGVAGPEAACIDAFKAATDDLSAWRMQPHQPGLRIGDGNPYQAVVISCEPTPAAESLRRRVRLWAGLDPQQDWHAHLSLLYADLSPALKTVIKQELGDFVWPVISIGACSLWRLQGPVEDWRCVARCDLPQSMSTLKE